jgi:hypothetical protein
MRASAASGARISFSRFTSRAVFTPRLTAVPSAARDDRFAWERESVRDMSVRAFNVNSDSTAQMLASIHR